VSGIQSNSTARKRRQVLVAEFCSVHDVSAPNELDSMMIENVVPAQEELEAVSARIARDGVTVPGSKGQLRPHPLIQVERALRDDVARGLERLSLLLGNAMPPRASARPTRSSAASRVPLVVPYRRESLHGD